MALRTTKWDVQDYLKTEAQIAAYLEAVAEENDPELLTQALSDAARARGMTLVSKQTGISREGLYKALSAEGNPSFETMAKIAGAFDMRIGLVRAEDTGKRAAGRILKKLRTGKSARQQRSARGDKTGWWAR